MERVYTTPLLDKLGLRPGMRVALIDIIRDTDVIAAAKAAGLVDNKVASFSPTHTALRLVIPVARRPH